METKETLEALVKSCRFDKKTGLFYRKVHPDKPTGKKTNTGFWAVSIQRRYHLAQRLVWLFINGEPADGWVCHKNGDRLDNRPANLYLRKVERHNFPTGVQKRGGRWIAYAYGKIAGPTMQRHLGSFGTKREALEARRSFMANGVSNG